MADRSPKEDDSSSGNRDEEDEQEDDEDADDREDAKFDPERLKAFNVSRWSAAHRARLRGRWSREGSVENVA